MSLLTEIPMMPLAGTLSGDEKVAVFDTDGIPTQTTVDALRGPLVTATAGQIIVGQASGDALAKTVSGDATLAATGALSLAAGSVTAAKFATALAQAFIDLDATQAAQDGDVIPVSVQAKDINGNNITTAARFWLELASAADASYAVAATTGTVVYNNTTLKRTLIETNASGLAVVEVTDTAAETIALAIGSGPGCPHISGESIELTFA